MLLLVVGCETPIEQQDVYGCTDAAACNFNENANFDNATCEFPEEFYDCDGSCLADSDGDGICDELEISGCQDQTACNYHLDATDGESCWYANEGCLCADGEGAELDQCNVCDSNPNNDCDVCHEAFGEPTALYKVLPDFETM